MQILDALRTIDPATVDYHEWIEIGMALKEASKDEPSIGYRIWDEWSAQDKARWRAGDCERRWTGFNSSGITRRTLFFLAFQNGYTLKTDGALDWDSYVQYDGEFEKSETELKRYLKALFKPDECIAYTLKSQYDEERRKYNPAGIGIYSRTVKDILDDLERYDGDISKALGDYNHDAGGWIRFNPVDGNGVRDKNITDYRYALVEADNMPVDEQFKKIIDLKLPCAAIVYSGKRSLHAIVRIDAKDYDEYRTRVKWLYGVLKEQGLNVDENNKNPSRLSRMPGLERGEKSQSLIDTNLGFKSFIEFEDYIKNGMQDVELPPPENFLDILKEDPPPAPEIIKGVLRQGHKMFISGPSKAGKSFLLIELAAAVAEGKKWIGFSCTQGKVLYINLEIDRASFKERIKDMYKARGIDLKKDKSHADNIIVWNLRGHAAPLERIKKQIVTVANSFGVSMIIFDPIYKIQGGDENAAGDIAKFTNQFDSIATETGAAIVYCHHHSKGAQGQKKAMDRASGSGVFARDADAIMDTLELNGGELYESDEFIGCSFWRIEATLREFPPFKPVNVIFDHPLHKVDKDGLLDNAEVLDPGSSRAKPKDTRSIGQRFYTAFNLLSEDGNLVSEKDLIKYFGKKPETIRKYIHEANNEYGDIFSRRKGIVYKITSEDKK